MLWSNESRPGSVTLFERPLTPTLPPFIIVQSGGVTESGVRLRRGTRVEVVWPVGATVRGYPLIGPQSFCGRLE